MSIRIFILAMQCIWYQIFILYILLGLIDIDELKQSLRKLVVQIEHIEAEKLLRR